MRFPGSLRLGPFVIALAAVGSASFLFAVSPSVRAECQPASGAPCPTPTPVNAFLSLDVTQGGPNTVINVSGGQFLPNESITLYWDSPSKVAGSATADSGGSFNTRVKPFAGDRDGVHRLCASVPPNPCANFSLQSATPSPESPSPSPVETPLGSPSPEESPGGFASAARVNPTLSGFDVISRPPFVFLPIFGAGAILLAFGYWAFNAARRPRRPGLLPSAAVVHRAIRPDYSAAFGAPPPAPNSTPEPSAWNEPIPRAAATPPAVPPPVPPPLAPQPEPPVEWGSPVEWGTGKSEWGFPEPPAQDEPEIPQPGD
ncbi:MAG TPA: hypothetical protein VJR46_04260 [Candidatus Dormibacteraeota bacterium]|nr:hypothetical protein [Candidatus Dormibacteraeota bacterium]